MRTARWLVVGVLGAAVVATSRAELPRDVDSWQPSALAGEVVFSLAAAPAARGDADTDDVLVGTRTQLYRMSPSGAVRSLDVPGPVRAMTASADGVWLGTEQGLLHVASGTDAVRLEALPGIPVLALSAHGDTLAVGTDDGLHTRTGDGSVERVWPDSAGPGRAVEAVLPAGAGVLFAHPDGLALARTDGSVSVLVPEISVVSLGRWDSGDALWAGTRGGPLLLVSEDGGSTWAERGEGLGFSALTAIARAPGDDGRIVAGGSGLADGTGNAGTQWSDDGGQTWQVRQDRLSNTHVYALLAQRDALPVRLSRPGLLASSVPLPVDTDRWYAGTNGSGVSTYRPDAPALTALRTSAPALRLLEPFVAGLLLLALLVPAYQHLKRGR